MPAELVDAVRRAVKRGRAPSVSAYVEQALTEKQGHDDIDVLLDEMLEETGGPLTPKEIEWADRILLGTKRTRR